VKEFPLEFSGVKLQRLEAEILWLMLKRMQVSSSSVTVKQAYTIRKKLAPLGVQIETLDNGWRLRAEEKKKLLAAMEVVQ